MRQRTLFLDSKVEQAIENLREFCPPKGFYACNSFGKDSVVLMRLLKLAGVPYDAHFHPSTVDPPEVRCFGKEHHPETVIEKPPDSMFKLILRQGIPPTRRMRYCCRVFKEEMGVGRIVLTGVRRAESRTRMDRQLVSTCPRMGKIVVNPLIEWSEEDIWDFIHTYDVPYCPLYDEGWKRLGCIGCPVAYFRTRLKEFERWPKFFRAYMQCFNKLAEREDRTWNTGDELFRWWTEEGRWKDEDHQRYSRLLMATLETH